jgi:predicted metal-dependent hydrolase
MAVEVGWMCATSPENVSVQMPDAFQRGIREFNSKRFFEAHEVWEERWLASPEPDKTFLQGIIQIAAAFHHHSRGNHRGACSLLLAGLGRLRSFPDNYYGIDLELLRNQAIAWAAVLKGGATAEHDLPIPQILLVLEQ